MQITFFFLIGMLHANLVGLESMTSPSILLLQSKDEGDTIWVTDIK